MRSRSFSASLLDWQARHGRHDLPWQVPQNPYYTWLSEVMLQQTQVVTVIRYFKAFTERFPNVQSLAEASEEEVMTLWQGLGYYSRARNLHACAQRVCNDFGGVFPANLAELESLPGIGRSTAGAIASLSMGLRASILDGNVKRVFCRHFGIEGYPEQSQVKKRLWQLADELLPEDHWGRYNQALMDLGATVCTPARARCMDCPLKSSCVALKEGRVAHLPAPKPKKPRLEIRALMLVVLDSDGRLFLVQQPDGGLWRGLWMPPLVDWPDTEVDWVEMTQQALKDRDLGHFVSSDSLVRGEPVIHDLTHQRWLFVPVLARACQVVGQNEWKGGEGFWNPAHKPVPRALTKVLEAEAVRRFLSFKAG